MHTNTPARNGIMLKPECIDNKVLIIDDDETFCNALAKALDRRGYNVVTTSQPDSVETMIREFNPVFAVIDLRIGLDSGLTVLQNIIKLNPRIHSIILTGYASIATAVEAIKSGAVHYLTKPASPDDIIRAFTNSKNDDQNVVNNKPLSIKRLEWEHINRVLEDHQGNISAAARALGMHRRSLQRKLQKHPSRE